MSADCPMNNLDKYVEKIARDIISSLNTKKTPEESCVIIAAFETLVNFLGIVRSPKNYNRFVDAMNEIAQVHELCKKAETAEELQEIIDKFVSMFSVNSGNRDVSSIRELVGRMLCNTDKTSTRSKRQAREECVTECPAGGIQDAREACEFFNCLNSSSLKSIFGFDEPNTEVDVPCLAFIVDTTGSMSDEIDAVKRIILEFLHAEQQFDGIGCYMLVPFNDVGPDDDNVPDESKCTS